MWIFEYSPVLAELSSRCPRSPGGTSHRTGRTGHVSGSSVSYLNDPTGLSTFTAANEDPDRDYFQVGAGLTAVLPGGWSPFANFSSILGLEDLNSYLFTVGVRKEL